MPQTLVEKIIARASGQSHIRPGEIAICRVDLAMLHDSAGPRRIAPRLEELGVRIWDPSKVVLVSDHYTPAVDPESVSILKFTRDWAREQGIERFHDMTGISHVMLAERGYLAPGMFCAGGDSHSTTGGAFGCYMAGFGATEMTGVLATGEIWTRTPESILVEWDGSLGDGVAAKDLMLFLCRQLGMENSFKAIEFAGTAIAGMTMFERTVLTNMTAELGAEAGIIAPDEVTLEAIEMAGGMVSEDALSWCSDADAQYEARHRFDATALTPQVAAPHSPDNVFPVGDVAGIPIQQAYIGACTGAKLSDLHMAARVLKGRVVAPNTRLLVAPASVETTRWAAADGTLEVLTGAGAMLLPTGCGACAGMGAGLLAESEACISSTNRNFKGRMGSSKSEVYLASPFTVAASAIEGRIADPRQFLTS